MKPAAQYAHKREEAIALIREHAPTRLQDPLIELLRPAIALSATRADDAQIALSASKFGGAPDVPPGFEWPMWNEKPLGFLAQINLEEAAEFDVEELLPKSGLLSFFYDVDEPDYTDVSTPGSWRVFHFENVQDRAPVVKETGFHACTIEFSAGWSSAQTIDVLPEDKEREWSSWCSISPCSNQEGRPYQGHQMLGYGSPVTIDAAWYATQRIAEEETGEWISPATSEVHKWIMLFQLDSDDEINTMWGDVGTLFFLIQRDALKAQQFDKAWMELQYT